MSNLTFKETYTLILTELEKSLCRIFEKEIVFLIDRIINTKNIIVVGAGRMGMMLQSFSMRLCHLGFNSYVVGCVNCPPICSKDLLLVASSSGETPTVREIVKKAKEAGAEIITITAKPESTIAKLSSKTVYLEAPSTIKMDKKSSLVSKQPMKTLFEQSLFIILESMVLQIMKKTNQTADDLSGRHANLE